MVGRARSLSAYARRARPDVALSHGSYAQIVGARLARVPVVTMMDYEHQPANHLSFRLAQRIVVPRVFPEQALRRCGARPERVARYGGFKEQLYLAGIDPDPALVSSLGLDTSRVTAAMRPAPEGALYHRQGSHRFDDLLEHVLREGGQVVLLPRDETQAARYRHNGVVVAPTLDGPTLLASVDLVVGGGGTMTREAALLGTPTYTAFAAELAAVDAELIRTGKLVDLRAGGVPDVTRGARAGAGVTEADAERVLKAVLEALATVHGSSAA
jgi:predicted glycosyltransferase